MIVGVVYKTVRVSVGRRLLYGAGFALIWASINIWIPLLGWVLLLFTPMVFFVPIIAMRDTGKDYARIVKPEPFIGCRVGPSSAHAASNE